MEELKIIMDTVAHLPAMALWVLAGLLLYKIVIIGSIFGVARLFILKAHDWAVKPRQKEIDEAVDKITVCSGSFNHLIVQLKRLVNVRAGVGSEWIHETDVRWLKEAIDEKMAKDKKG